MMYELYVPNTQALSGYIDYLALDQHLERTGRINRAFSIDDELVKGWLANPSSYPEEFKVMTIYLWKSQRGTGLASRTASLLWINEELRESWFSIEGGSCKVGVLLHRKEAGNMGE